MSFPNRVQGVLMIERADEQKMNFSGAE